MNPVAMGIAKEAALAVAQGIIPADKLTQFIKVLAMAYVSAEYSLGDSQAPAPIIDGTGDDSGADNLIDAVASIAGVAITAANPLVGAIARPIIGGVAEVIKEKN